MTKTLNHVLIALSLVVVLGVLTQSLVVIFATIGGFMWSRLQIKHWNRAKNKMKPPSGGIKINKNYSGSNSNNFGLAF